MEHVRIRLQLQGQKTIDKKKPKYTGSFDAAKRIFQRHGIRGLYHGTVATLLRESAFCFNFFLFYGELKTIFGNPDDPDHRLTIYQTLLAGGVTGMITWGIIYPIDSVKSIMQAQPINLKKRTFDGVLDVVRHYWKNNGIRWFYRGLNVCMARSFPVNACTFCFYEIADDIIDKYRVHYHERESLELLI